MIFDAHTHIGPFEPDVETHTREFLRLMDSYGVNKAIVMCRGGVEFSELQDAKQWNDRLGTAARLCPDRLFPFGNINTHLGEAVAIEEMNRCVREYRIRGWGELWEASGIDRIVEEAARLNLIMFFHAGTPPHTEPFRRAMYASQYPQMIFILGHLGLGDLWHEAVASAKRFDNIILETSVAPDTAIARAVKEVGAERVIYGSDLLPGWKYTPWEIERIRKLDISQPEKELILGGNIERILNVQL